MTTTCSQFLVAIFDGKQVEEKEMSTFFNNCWKNVLRIFTPVKEVRDRLQTIGCFQTFVFLNNV